jgi:hypothetical protein
VRTRSSVIGKSRVRTRCASHRAAVTRERRPSGAEPGRPEEVRREVPVAQTEPRGLAEGRQRTQRGERVALDTPALRRIGQRRQRVEDGVEIGGDVEPEELLVVARIPDDGDVGGVSALRETPKKPGSPHATREDRDPSACHQALPWG